MRRTDKTDSRPALPLRVSDRLYRWLLVLYPPTFRRTYGAHMAQVFRDCCRTTWNQQGGIALFVLWLLACGDLVASALAERGESSKAAYRAVRRKRAIMTRRFRRNLTISGALLALLLVVMGIVSFFPPAHLALFRLEPQVAKALPGGQYYQMPGPGMLPTIHSNQYLAVEGYDSGKPQRGDIIAFYVLNTGVVRVKRVIAIPGDTVDITDTSIILNGVTLHEPYILHEPSGFPENINVAIKHVTLAAGQYFVLGDNRLDSDDSRYYGPVPQQNIIGKVVEISSFAG